MRVDSSYNACHKPLTQCWYQHYSKGTAEQQSRSVIRGAVTVTATLPFPLLCHRGQNTSRRVADPKPLLIDTAYVLASNPSKSTLHKAAWITINLFTHSPNDTEENTLNYSKLVPYLYISVQLVNYLMARIYIKITLNHL